MNLIYPEIVTPEFKNHWQEGKPEAEYHAERSAISSTSLRQALKSPKHFHEFIVKGKQDVQTPAMRFGSIVHMAILETDKFRAKYVRMPEFGDQRTAVNKEAKKRWMADLPQGALAVTNEELDRLNSVIESIQKYKHPDTKEPIIVNLLKGSIFEASGYFRDPVTGLKCRIRPDILRPDLSAMPDLKTTRDPSPAFFSREIWDRQYFVQMAFYAMGVKEISGEEPRLPCFIAVQNEAPFDVAVYECDAAMMERGAKAVRYGLNLIKSCMETGEWSGIQSKGADVISLPAYTDNLWEWQ